MEDIEIRLADENDIDAINDFYNRIYKKKRTREQFIWEFNSSPAGKAIYVIAEHSGQIVGTQCAIPYYIIDKEGRTRLTAKSEDTLVDPAHRGKNIFENMYFQLFMECRKAGIGFIWGFTYAQKPFLKLGFEIPYHSSMGLIVLRTFPAFKYYSHLSSKNSLVRKFKILGLCVKSSFDHFLSSMQSTKQITLTEERIALSTASHNYLAGKGLFGLKLDVDFLNYRLYKNTYSSNYYQSSIIDKGELKASVIYTVNHGIGYILHLYFKDEKNGAELIQAALQKSRLKECFTVRFWGFQHNPLNHSEISLLEKCKFTFVNRGISFVGMSLTKEQVEWKEFHLSRLASQGTD